MRKAAQEAVVEGTPITPPSCSAEEHICEPQYPRVGAHRARGCPSLVHGRNACWFVLRDAAGGTLLCCPLRDSCPVVSPLVGSRKGAAKTETSLRTGTCYVLLAPLLRA